MGGVIDKRDFYLFIMLVIFLYGLVYNSVYVLVFAEWIKNDATFCFDFGSQ